MPLAIVSGEFGVVFDPEFRVSDKGNAWVKIRGVSKDRVRDSLGNWTDSDPCYIDIIAAGKSAEHLTDSVAKGDSITVVGKLKQREFEVDGVKRTNLYVDAEVVGVSTRWGSAKTQRVLDANSASPMSKSDHLSYATESLGATEVSDAAPF